MKNKTLIGRLTVSWATVALFFWRPLAYRHQLCGSVSATFCLALHNHSVVCIRGRGGSGPLCRAPCCRLERRRRALPTVRWELVVSCFATNPTRPLLRVGGQTTSVTIEAKSVTGVLNFRALRPPKKECAYQNKVWIKPMGIRENAMHVC